LLKQKKFWIGGIIIVIAIGVVSFLAFRGAATYYYTVSEAIAQQSSLMEKNIRIAGKVGEGSVVRQSATNTTDFILIDTVDLNQSLHISYKGAIPDAFKEGNDAVVEGRLSGSDIFKAQQIIVKCPSKYVPKQ
jgi:cytochrome c-type biogenesis protein CcmE